MRASSPTNCCRSQCSCSERRSAVSTERWAQRRSTRGSTTRATGTSSSCPAARSSPASSSAPVGGSTRFRPTRRRKNYALRPPDAAYLPLAPDDGYLAPLLAEAPRGLDRRAEVEALVLRLLDQHHRLESIDVVNPLLLALRRDLRLVRPVIELHLRDAGDLADLAQIELDLREVLGEIYRLKKVHLPADSHTHPRL